MTDGEPESPVPLHYHSCPECYEARPCTMACSIIVDLFDHLNAREHGSHVTCSECGGEDEDPAILLLHKQALVFVEPWMVAQ